MSTGDASAREPRTAAGAARPTAREWLARFAAALGLEPPDDAQLSALLELAAEAAHASERAAAPVACWLCGRAGTDPLAAARVARQVADR